MFKLGVQVAELHRKHQAANPAAPGSPYVPPTDANVDDWKVNDEIFKYSSEELEGAMKVIFEQIKIASIRAENARLRVSNRRKELESANGLLQTRFLLVAASHVRLRHLPK
jgi:hypothetical protein